MPRIYSTSWVSPRDSQRVDGGPTTRIALVNLPRMLHEIIREVVATQRDMVIVTDIEDPTELEAAVTERPDFLITGSDVELGDVSRLLDAHPRLRVVAVSTDGRRAFLSEVRPNHTPLGEASPQKLLNVIRSAVRVP